MEKLRIWTLIGRVCLVFFVLSCSTKKVTPEILPGIVGTWRLYEKGYSPGAGYIIDKVSANPAQDLTLTQNGELKKQGKILEDLFREINYYQIDSTKDGTRMIFLRTKDDTFEKYWGVSIQIDTLTLRPFCVEGCHYNFIKIK